ncbi:TPR domain protein [Sulfitobacter noctilucicola]|uniref:FAD assembly factor SdhE n=1 Tax=Sulfitobacter noctilucicola TaxID=1342301 RepID=A0A7W6M948_9RHOB|nr:succinate dehydrogenase assembly factor 2 [Sulfitobacter noctilucicola]KIN64394.1 TPR domain protein [Sulfitobacter noctilucicola]MBB4174447.1 antitoxin CptB [Sulfitobacter noctilucicola]
MAEELHEHKVKRLHMRSIRRGIKEMDLILTSYATDVLPNLDDEALTLYDALLNESDHDLYQWVTGQFPAPDPYAAMIDDIRTNFTPLV